MKLIELEEVDSTNDYLKREYQNLPMQTCVTAKYQTKGRGRNGHVWESHANENLIMSFLFKDFHKIEDAWEMTQLATCSVVCLLDRYRIKATIKWPNDIYVDGKKICGILMESISNESSLDCLVVGIGINLNTKEFDDELKDKATSYYLIKNKKISILKVKLKIYHQIKKELKHIDDKKYLEFFKEHNYLKDKEAYILLNNEKKLVKILDVNEDNTLKILCDNKEMNINSGEVTFHL